MEMKHVGNGLLIPWVQQQKLVTRTKRNFVLSDDKEGKYYVSTGKDDLYKYLMSKKYKDNMSFDDPFYPKQWYLPQKGVKHEHLTGCGTSQKGSDKPTSCAPQNSLNILPVWNMGWTGRGVTLSVLDDGLMHSNMDILPNYEPYVSYDLADFSNQDSDPTPNTTFPGNNHGTYCAAIMAAAANNSYCGVGVAYEARVGGVRLLEGGVTDLQEASALNYALDKVDIYSASWGPRDDGLRVEGPSTLAAAAFERGIREGRKGKGALYVWAVGNGGSVDDNCNLDGYSSSIYTISINALTETGRSCFYNEPCASSLASTYVGGFHIMPDKAARHRSTTNIVVPELDGHCHSSFQGTSAAAPLAAGVLALVLQANPDLTWRDAQHIIVHTASKPNNDTGWHTNAAGLHYHLEYGFGALDALSMVTTAVGWTNVPKQRMVVVEATALPLVITKNSKSNVTLHILRNSSNTFEIDRLEHVVVTLTLKHEERGKLELFLISPSGTTSQILTRRKNDSAKSGFLNWDFVSVHFWDENSIGSWELVLNNHSNISGVVERFWLTLYGYQQPNQSQDVRLIGASCSAEVQLFYTSFALPEMFGTGDPIKSQNQPSKINAHAHLTTHALYNQKKADSFIGCCKEI
uniref:P/Homo B domain-containing protein n=1 Tax=Timema bartmani TaxID=61472 RepID=A0A7R9ELR6_9NEOP|nr:unnamed protein product [Timema bartmani]